MNHITNLRKLIDIFEDQDLKNQVINAVNNTEDTTVLQKVLKTLKGGDIEKRIAHILGKDVDAKKFLDTIAEIIVKIDAPIEEKDQFLANYPKGIVNTSLLLDGGQHSFSDIVGPGFNTELFKILTTALSSQGVGPGEVALSVLSPDIKWSGRSAGGGDVQIGNQAVEVKTSVKKGGRWVNARKAKTNMVGIKDSIEKALIETQKKSGMTKGAEVETMPVNKYIAKELDNLLKLCQDQVDDITDRSRGGYGNKKSSGLEDAIFEISGLSDGFHSSMAEGVAELQELNSGLPRIGSWIIRNLKKVGNRIDLPQLIKQETSKKSGTDSPVPNLQERLGLTEWVNSIRPNIDPALLADTTKKMADGLFNHVDNSKYQQALASGNPADIKEAIMEVGFDNYKKYSGFDGLLMMNLQSEVAQYFKDYASMRGHIQVSTPYIYAPAESEAMPQVNLLDTMSGGNDAGEVAPAAAPVADVPMAQQPEPTAGPVNQSNSIPIPEPLGTKNTMGRTRRNKT
jgi:hypothetical protein